MDVKQRKLVTLATLALGGSSAQAAVIAFGPPVGVTTSTNIASTVDVIEGVTWDIDGVSGDEFAFSVTSISSSSAILNMNNPNNSIRRFGAAINLGVVDAGQVIGSSQQFTDLTQTTILRSSSGAVFAAGLSGSLSAGTSLQDFYFGFEFTKDSNIHYGYLHFQALPTAPSSQLTDGRILGGAYESVAGQSITVAPIPVPEPSSAMLLAMGVAGLAGYRKRA